MGPGILLALLSGIANGLFSVPLRIIPVWKWENIWPVFILTACIVMPAALVLPAVERPAAVLAALPRAPLAFALSFGFAWGFGAILFGLSVARLGVSLANSLVIGLTSALGSLAPLLLAGAFRIEPRQLVLFAGVFAFLAGVWLCGRAGRLREGAGPAANLKGFVFAAGAGIMGAVFNTGYALALPIAGAGERLGLSRFTAGNLIWLLMLSAGAVPNLAYSAWLLRRNRTARLFVTPRIAVTWGLSITMGVLWAGSIFLYGAAAPRLGDLGPSIGWPLSLAAGLLVANAMGYLLGEWKTAEPAARRLMLAGIAMLLAAIALCAASAAL